MRLQSLISIPIGFLAASLALTLSAGRATAAPWTLVPAAPSGVFRLGDTVRLQVSGLTAGARIPTPTLTTYGGNRIIVGAIPPDGKVDLGPLPRGYYEFTASDGVESETAPIVVVPDLPLHRTSRVATDAAYAWLIPQDRFKQGADLLRSAGMSWVRERLSWGEVEPTRGVFHWGKYDGIVNDEHEDGVLVDQIFHTSPAWARADHAANRFPDDLRDAYNFARAAGAHYHGLVQSWEIWNEADGGFSNEPGSDYAAFLKAVYLGLKAGDPQAIVLQNSLVVPAGHYEESLYKNGTPGYFDVLNYHLYANPRDYPAIQKAHFALLNRYHVPNDPIWVTESGMSQHAVNGTLTEQQKRMQAEWIPKSYAMSFAAGTDRHFFFVFPHYMENGGEFGVMDAAMNPYPGYAALATVEGFLGGAQYTGRVSLPGAPKVEARLFDSRAGRTLVVWSNGGALTVNIPVNTARARLFNCVGASITPPSTPSSQLSFTVSPSPIYVLLPRNSKLPVMRDRLQRSASGPGPRKPAGGVVLRVRPPNDTFAKNEEAYQLKAGQPVPIRIEVYNFGKRTQDGDVRLSAPAGWTLQPTRWSGHFTPMCRLTFSASLTPPAGVGLGRFELTGAVYPTGKTAPASPVALDLEIDPATIRPAAEKPIDAAAAGGWRDNISSNGTVSHREAGSGSEVFNIAFTGPGDRWAYPMLQFPHPQNWRRFDAVAFEYAATVDDPGARIRLMLHEPGGAAYYTNAGYPAITHWKRVVVPFNELAPGGFAPPDPDGKLDTDQIAALLFGCNTTRDQITLRLRNLALIRLP